MLTMGRQQTKYIYPALLWLLLLLFFFLRQAGAADRRAGADPQLALAGYSGYGETAGNANREIPPSEKIEKNTSGVGLNGLGGFGYQEPSKDGYSDILLWNEARARVIESEMRDDAEEYLDDALETGMPAPDESEKPKAKKSAGFLNRYLYDGASNLYRHADGQTARRTVRQTVQKAEAPRKQDPAASEKNYRERRRELLGSMMRVVRNSPEYASLKKELDELDAAYAAFD